MQKNINLRYKYNPSDFKDEEEKYFKDWLDKMYKGYEDKDLVQFEMYRAFATDELKCLWKSGVIAKVKADEIKEYIWGLKV